MQTLRNAATQTKFHEKNGFYLVNSSNKMTPSLVSFCAVTAIPEAFVVLAKSNVKAAIVVQL